MSSFFIELWESIFTPGPTPTILRATNITFAALQLVLGLLLLATWSVHFIVLSVLSACLWRSINWFAGELAAAQAREQRDKDAAEKKLHEDKGGDDSDTEVERSQVLDVAGGEGRSADVEVERIGEAKLRVLEPSRSNASTEDEWERVSENEDGKGQ